VYASGCCSYRIITASESNHYFPEQREKGKHEARLRVALDATPVVVFNQDKELRYTWIYNAKLAVPAEMPTCCRPMLQPA